MGRRCNEARPPSRSHGNRATMVARFRSTGSSTDSLGTAGENNAARHPHGSQAQVRCVQERRVLVRSDVPCRTARSSFPALNRVGHPLVTRLQFFEFFGHDDRLRWKQLLPMEFALVEKGEFESMAQDAGLRMLELQGNCDRSHVRRAAKPADDLDIARVTFTSEQTHWSSISMCYYIFLAGNVNKPSTIGEFLLTYRLVRHSLPRP
jgi:hypothetical protein